MKPLFPKPCVRVLGASLLVILCLLGRIDAAHAQARLAGESPTPGVAVPAGVLAGDAEATAVELNPANLGFLPSWNLNFIYTGLNSDGTQGGAGEGLFLAGPLPFFDQISLGGAVELMSPPQRFFPFTIDNEVKLAFSVAWRITPFLSFGATYAHIFLGNVAPAADGSQAATHNIDTLDLAASARLGRFLALSLVVHDIPSPSFFGVGIERVYEPELAFRPIGNNRVELAGALRIGERRGDVSPRLRLQVMPYPGLILKASFEAQRDEFDTGIINQNDFRALAGIELNLEHVGVGGYLAFGSDTGAGHFHGGSATLRISGDHYPALVPPRQLERIELAGLDERKITSLLSHLRQLEQRRRTDGVLLILGDTSGGSWARMEELRAALLRLRRAHLHVFAYGTELNTKAYYLASAAERIYLDPAGQLRLLGLTSTAMYFKGTFDKLGIRADFVSMGEFKGAPERWTKTGPSPAVQDERNRITDDIYQRLLKTISADRHIDIGRLHAIIDRAPYNPAQAQNLGLVDEVRMGDEVEDALSQRLGHRVQAVAVTDPTARPRSWAPPLIGVILVDGEIIEGKSKTLPILDMHFAGHETLLQALADARDDPQVRGVVLRISSPGGSALASELIAREVARTSKVKPVVCSLGGVAASGGYYIASACERIFAEPSTITGSIGIFTGKFDLAGLADKLGVTRDTSSRGAHADIDSYWRPYTEEERRQIGQQLTYFYDRFVAAVSSGRKLTVPEVDRLGRGHVWTGAEARERHLVDQIGGFMDAVDEIKRLANLHSWEEAELKEYTGPRQSLLSQLLQLLGTKMENPLSWLGTKSVVELISSVPGSLWLVPSAPQARLEYNLQVD